MTARVFQTELIPMPGSLGLKVHHWTQSDIVRGAPGFGLCLMGGGLKDPNALRWLAERAGHGHAVVLDVRDHPDELTYPGSTTCSLAAIDGFERLTTLVVDDREKANHPFVVRCLEEAAAVFLPGGDQTRYWETWHATEVQRRINRRLATRLLVLGGSSAGMHVMGGIVHTPSPGRSVDSLQSLADPYLEPAPDGDRAGITFRGDFLQAPFLVDTLTDTHWSERDRMGRSITFLARILQDGLRTWETASVLACDEGVAVCIDQEGQGRVFGCEIGAAFRITATCPPQECRPGEPLTWQASGGALRMRRVGGTLRGTGRLGVLEGEGSGSETTAWNVRRSRLQPAAA